MDIRVVPFRDMLIVSTQAAQDNRISLAARGLLFLLLSKPADVHVYLDDKYEDLLGELNLYGYLRGNGTGIPEVSSVPVIPKTHEKTQKKMSAAQVALDELMTAYGGTKAYDYKDGLLGYQVPNWSKEFAWAKKIVAGHYDIKDVEGCYAMIKGWKWKQGHISLAAVYEHMGAYQAEKEQKLRTIMPERVIPDSLFVGESDEDNLL